MDVSNASGYDGTSVAADACYVAKHATGRSKVVVTEATNPQVRQVVKTFAAGFGLEVVEVPHRNGTTDLDELERAAADAAAVIFQQPKLLRLPRAGSRSRRERLPTQVPCRLRTSISCPSACSRRRVDTAPLSHSVKDRRPATSPPSAARTTASSRHARNSFAACLAASSVRRWTPRASAAMS
jgi:hypothetical protein